MAAPVIDSVSPASVNLAPGQFADVVVTAHDPDSASGTGSFAVTDGQGNTSNATVAITITDPLTFGAGSSNVPGVTVQKIASTATTATYRIQA